MLSYKVMDEGATGDDLLEEKHKKWNTNAYAYKLIGQQLGPYRLTELIGKGGMGIVYEAINESEKSVAAIKILHPWHGDNAQFVRRFRREAKAMLQLRHEHIVEVHAVEKQDEFLYIVMEYVNGGTLYDMVRRNIRLKEQAIIELIIQVLQALETAHQSQNHPPGHQAPKHSAHQRRQSQTERLWIGKILRCQPPKRAGTQRLAGPLLEPATICLPNS